MEEVDYQCPDCGTQLVQPETFVDFGCPNEDCGTSLVPESKADPLKHECGLCGNEFDTEHSMKTHRGQKHEQCGECGEWFKNKRGLSTHKSQSH